MQLQLNPRFDYGHRVPLVSYVPGGAIAVAGPEALSLRTSVDLDVTNGSISSEFTVSAGDQVWFRLVWFPSHEGEPEQTDAAAALSRTEAWWRSWSERCSYQGPYHETVLRSLMTLKALTYAPTGGIVAAATTSLPEEIGGVRNWDYRYCWLRDGAFTSRRSPGSAIRMKRLPWGLGCVGRLPGIRRKCRSCTGSAARRG